MSNIINEAINTNGLENTKKIFSNRLIKLRADANINKTELAKKMEYELNLSTFRLATISDWEQQKTIPRKKYLYVLCDIFGVDAAYLLGLQDEKRAGNKLPNATGLHKIQKEDKLKHYDNQPVWCVPKANEITDGFWALVNASEQKLITSNDIIRFKDINFDVYRFLSPYSFAIDSNLEILEKKYIPKFKKLWVQGIGGSFVSRQKIKGFYTYDTKLECVINEAGVTLSLDTYGINWVAYSDEIVEKEMEQIL